MKKILINRKPVDGPWGGGNNFVRAIHEYSLKYGFEPVNEIKEDLDAIFMIDPRYDELGVSINEIAQYKSYRPQTKVIYRINECDARKGLISDIDPVIQLCSQITDLCVFISDWIKDYHVKDGWACTNNEVIYSGTNKNHFRPNKKIDNGKINLVTHHWSDNLLKGHDVYQKIDEWLEDNEDFTFTYIGRSHGELKNSVIIPPTFGQNLGDLLSSYDVYISASRHDPGPNHIIESLACEIPTYAHIDSGGAVEMVGKDHTYASFEELKNILELKDFQKNKALKPPNWENCIDNYFNCMLQLF
tara:strand:+ start:62 stop:967 length:906 start_codon:yes stop_codon:yes gene_type:complete